jgi:SAM-dependent methyltransferase
MHYHTFLCYNSKNRSSVKVIHDYLTNSGLRVFFDQASLSPGAPFQESIEAALRESLSILVIIGPDGVGPWQEEENYSFQLLKVNTHAQKEIIPILLPGAKFGPTHSQIPLFLNRYNAFAFSDDVNNKDDLFQIMRAIPQLEIPFNEFERPFLRDEQDRLITNTIKFYNNEAELYYERWKDTLPLGPMWTFIQEVKKRPKGHRILDAGCGPGHHSRFFADQGCDVAGVDMSASMIAIAEKTRQNKTTFLHADMRNLQRVFKDRNLFDGIWACASCLHLTKEAFSPQLYEFAAILKPGGILGLSMQVGVPSTIQEDGRFFERYEEDDLMNRLARHGFHIVNVNTQITDRNTKGTLQIKKWLNIAAVAPSEKERLQGKLSGR